MHVHISFDHILVEVQQLILSPMVFFWGGNPSPACFLGRGTVYTLGTCDSWSPTKIPKADPDVNPHRDPWISNIAAWNITQILMITRTIRWILCGDLLVYQMVTNLFLNTNLWGFRPELMDPTPPIKNLYVLFSLFLTRVLGPPKNPPTRKRYGFSIVSDKGLGPSSLQ